MHLQHAAQRPAGLGHLELQLGQQTHEPLETLLISVDPEEINLWSRRINKTIAASIFSHLLEVEHVGGDVIAPLVVTLGTLFLDLPVPEI